MHYLRPPFLHPQTAPPRAPVLGAGSDAESDRESAGAVRGPPARAGGPSHAAAAAPRTVPVVYAYRNPYTKYLPHKLAEYLVNSFGDKIRVKRRERQWTVPELNRILHENLVATHPTKSKSVAHLHTFHVIEWEHDSCEGIARARCAPFSDFHKKKGVAVRCPL